MATVVQAFGFFSSHTPPGPQGKQTISLFVCRIQRCRQKKSTAENARWNPPRFVQPPITSVPPEGVRVRTSYPCFRRTSAICMSVRPSPPLGGSKSQLTMPILREERITEARKKLRPAVVFPCASRNTQRIRRLCEHGTDAPHTLLRIASPEEEPCPPLLYSFCKTLQPCSHDGHSPAARFDADNAKPLHIRFTGHIGYHETIRLYKKLIAALITHSPRKSYRILQTLFPNNFFDQLFLRACPHDRVVEARILLKEEREHLGKEPCHTLPGNQTPDREEPRLPSPPLPHALLSTHPNATGNDNDFLPQNSPGMHCICRRMADANDTIEREE